MEGGSCQRGVGLSCPVSLGLEYDGSGAYSGLGAILLQGGSRQKESESGKVM